MKRNLIVHFHSLDDPIWFERVISLLQSKYTFVDLNYFRNLNGRTAKKGFCHITFDDGHRSFYTLAYPILKTYNVPTTVFVSPKSIINQGNFWFQEISGYDHNIMIRILSKELLLSSEAIYNIPFNIILKCLPLKLVNNIIDIYQIQTNTSPKSFQNLNIHEINELDSSGLITIGAHTLNHPILNNESHENSENEIRQSIIQLQDLLNHPVRFFAYPNGIPSLDFGEREINYLKNLEISLALSTEGTFISQHHNRLALPRLGLSHGSEFFIECKLTLGRYWDMIRYLRYTPESKIRHFILSLLNKR